MYFEDEDLFEEFSVLDEYNENIFQEAKLNTEKRNELPSSEFGIPEKRAFPLNDKAHVEAAVRMFPHADDEYKEQLAQRILVKAKKLGMDTSGWDSLNKYVNEYDMTFVEQESTGQLLMEAVSPETAEKNRKENLRLLKYDPKKRTIVVDGPDGQPMTVKAVITNFDVNSTEPATGFVMKRQIYTGTDKHGDPYIRIPPAYLEKDPSKLMPIIDHEAEHVNQVNYQKQRTGDKVGHITARDDECVLEYARKFIQKHGKFLSDHDKLEYELLADFHAAVKHGRKSYMKALRDTGEYGLSLKNLKTQINDILEDSNPQLKLFKKGDYSVKSHINAVEGLIKKCEYVKKNCEKVVELSEKQAETYAANTPFGGTYETNIHGQYEDMLIKLNMMIDTAKEALDVLHATDSDTLSEDDIKQLKLMNLGNKLATSKPILLATMTKAIISTELRGKFIKQIMKDKPWLNNTTGENINESYVLKEFNDFDIDSEFIEEYGYNAFDKLSVFLEGESENDNIESHVVTEGFFAAGFGNLRSRIADYLGEKFTVSHVKKPMASSEMFDIKNSEIPDTIVKVEGTGTGVKITAKNGSDVERYGNNVPLSNAFNKLINIISNLFPGQVVTEAAKVSPTGTGLTDKFDAEYYMSTRTFELVKNDSVGLTVHRDGQYWFSVDEMIAPLIRICNQKGYQTSDCCFGHIGISKYIEGNKLVDVSDQSGNSGTYIGFVGRYNFKNLPSGWHQSTYRNGTRTSLDYLGKPVQATFDSWKILQHHAESLKAVMALYKYFERLPDLNGKSQPTKEGYHMGERSIEDFKFLLESAKEDDDDEEYEKDDEKEDDEKEELEEFDITSFGKDSSDVHNEYNEKEVETLNKLIAAENDAMNDYFEAGKNTDIEVLRRLYADIGAEERFHAEQLIYAKCVITGEKYEPRDPKVKEEYKELLEMGMDEDTALSTAFDKRSMAQDGDDEGDDLSEEQQDAEVLEYAVSQFVAAEELLQNIDITKLPSMEHSIESFVEAYVFQEAIDNVAPGASSAATANNVQKKSGGPIKLLVKAFTTLIQFIRKLGQNLKMTIRRITTRMKRIHQFIKANGISGIFAKGVYLYFYNDKNCTYMNSALQYIDMCDRLTGVIANNVNMRGSWHSSNILPNGVNPITFGNFDKGLDMLRGVVLTKTKVIVTQDNQGKLAELFFGYTGTPANLATGESNNIFYKIKTISDATQAYLDKTEKFMGELQSAHDDPANAGRIEQYNQAIKSMTIIKNSIQKFIKALVHDNNEVIKLNNGILEETKQKDDARAQRPQQQQQNTN